MPAERTPTANIPGEGAARALSAVPVGPSMDPDAYAGDFLQAAPDEVRIRLVQSGDAVKLLVFSPRLGWTEKILSGIDPDAIGEELCG